MRVAPPARAPDRSSPYHPSDHRAVPDVQSIPRDLARSVDESAHDVRRALRVEYAGLAGHYDRRWARYVARSTAATLRRLALQPNEALLDVGCGTGALLAAVRAIPGARAVGADLSPEMLAVAHARLEPGTRRAAVALVAADALSLPFGDAAFDAVVSSSVLHFVPDPRTALAEWRRVLRPGGRLVVTDWCADGLVGRAMVLARRLADPALGRPHRPAFKVRAFARVLGAAGFTDCRIDRYRIAWGWRLMTATARRPA